MKKQYLEKEKPLDRINGRLKMAEACVSENGERAIKII